MSISDVNESVERRERTPQAHRLSVHEPDERFGVELYRDGQVLQVQRLEREAEETAQRVMQGGELGVYRMAKSEVHVQRMSITDSVSGAVGKAKAKVPGLGNDEDQQYQDLSDGDLAETVGTLVENQREIINTLDAQQSGLLDKTAETATKMGAGAAVLSGAAMMTAEDPGMLVTMGTMVTAAGGKVLAGAGYDHGKAKTSDAAAVGKEKLAGVKEVVDEFIDEKIRERLRGSDTDGYPGD